ncbi:NAD(P)/FAD-dependent oxidoreductase [Bdellovibrio sp. NC01]|uniref:NAD(P)/FAD-dependent oxidoreductase n=1 Tax=Bdellovibrio sp. NC01 TaxID=2220073 RepID=UPI001FF00C71|nr:NAD(P)/FAD-dependent oxidoreductase [Bdellovibrio sp. NC01]
MIIGGGFAGLAAGKALANKSGLHVVLIDQRNHHLFQPLLYQVATAGLNPADIAVPIRAQFTNAENVEVHLGRVSQVNLKDKFIQEGDIRVDFDYLILACGAQHSYFGKNEWEEFAPGLKTVEQATEIRRRILSAFEEAENEQDPKRQEALLNFVVVGGGPTGVELAGAIADIARTVLVEDFKHINPASAHVMLVEAGPKILASFDEKLSAHALRDLKDLGVDVRLNGRVENITATGVQIGNEFVQTKSVFWAAGVQASRLNLSPTVEMDRAGRIKVNKDFSVPGHKEVFVVGDMAAFELTSGKSLPGLAPAAMQAGRYVADVILKEIAGKKHDDFKYLDKGQMATIGKRKAITQYGRIRMVGFFAWMAWLFVHVFYLIGFKNRISVMAQWTWSYLFSKRGARLITERDWKLKP